MSVRVPQLRELSEQLKLSALSMGMTNDYAVAIEEGSTMVRIGRAIFGNRPEAGDDEDRRDRRAERWARPSFAP